MYNVIKFGAEGIAFAKEQAVMNDRVHADHTWPENYAFDVYYPQEGKEYDSIGIQKAIDAAYDNGGGTVFVPAGDYLIAPIKLKSNVILELAPGATLWGSPNIKDYYDGKKESLQLISDYCPGSGDLQDDDHVYINRLVSAVDADNTGITGYGEINAQSPHFIFPWLNKNHTEEDGTYTIGERKIIRPKEMIVFKNCTNVTLRDFNICNSVYWTLVMFECDGVLIDGLKLDNFEGPNADGIDLVASSNVTISNCRIHVGDDAICMKNVKPDFTMRNITVTNCLLRTFCNGIKFGTETWGNFENITISNLVIQTPENDFCHTHGGINLNSVDGGDVRNVNISNIVMENVDCPLYLIVGKRSQHQKAVREPQAGQMERISITNITARNSKFPCFITGEPDSKIKDVFLSNIRISKDRAIVTEPHTEPVPERPEQYPTPWRYGSRLEGDKLPAYGLYMRHVDGVKIENFNVDTADEEVRPMIKEDN